MYDATELEVLSKACSRIEELGLSCAQIDFTEWPILEPFAWRPAAAQTPQEKELVKFLVRTQLPRETPLNIKGRYCHISESSCASNGTISTRCDGRRCNGKRISRAPIEVPAVRRANPEILGSAPFVDRAVGFQSHACDSRLPWDHSGRQRSQILALLHLRGESETVLPHGHSKKQIVAVPVKPSEISKYMKQPRVLVDPGTVWRMVSRYAS